MWTRGSPGTKPRLAAFRRAKAVRQLTDWSMEDFEGDGEAHVHDAEHATPSLAFGLSRLTQERVGATPIGVFRSIERPVYDELMAEQIAGATAKTGPGDLEALLHAGETWTVA